MNHCLLRSVSEIGDPLAAYSDAITRMPQRYLFHGALKVMASLCRFFPNGLWWKSQIKRLVSLSYLGWVDISVVRRNVGVTRRNIGVVRRNIGVVRWNVSVVRCNVGVVSRKVGVVRWNVGVVRWNIGVVRQNIGVVRRNVGVVR
jgi:hypothetical protein